MTCNDDTPSAFWVKALGTQFSVALKQMCNKGAVERCLEQGQVHSLRTLAEDVRLGLGREGSASRLCICILSSPKASHGSLQPAAVIGMA